LRIDLRKELEIHRYTPGLHKQPWKELQPCNVVLGPRGRRGRPDSDDLAGGLGQGSGWGGSRSCGEPTWVLTHGGEATGGRVWRRPAMAAAGSSAPASWWLGLSNKRKGELLGILGQAGAKRVGGASVRRVELAVQLHRRGGSSAVARLLRARGKGVSGTALRAPKLPGASCLKPAKNKNKTHLLLKRTHRSRPTLWWPPRPTGVAPSKAPSSRFRLARGLTPPSSGFRLARGLTPPSSGFRLS
jgi:hypothetical protein